MVTSPSYASVFRVSIFSGLIAVASCGSDRTSDEPLIRPVRTALVRSSASEQVQSFTGSTQAGAEVELSFKVSGTLMNLHIRMGDSVERGQLIAELDPSDYELLEDQARAAHALRIAEQRNHKSQYERVRALYENNNASRTELDAARARSESADSMMAASGKRLDLATKQLSYTRLEAPVAGLISDVPSDENENFSAGHTVARLASGALPEVQVSIPGTLISQVRRDDKVMVKLSNVEGPPLPATVIEVGVTAALGRTTFPVTAELHEDHPAIRPGMAAEVEFRFAGDGEGRLLIPTVAVGEDRKGRFVFVFTRGEGDIGVARRRAVEISTVSSEGIEILSGLREGERVITAGVRRIVDGLQVRLLDASEPSGKAHL